MSAPMAAPMQDHDRDRQPGAAHAAVRRAATRSGRRWRARRSARSRCRGRRRRRGSPASRPSRRSRTAPAWPASAGQLPGSPKVGSAMTFAISRASARPAANEPRVRAEPLSQRRLLRSRWRESCSRGSSAAIRALAEDEHAVHQLDVLVDLGREHDDRHALARRGRAAARRGRAWRRCRRRASGR